MPRKHSGGFIAESSYWDIGTESRGRDGMNARDAAKRYNDHKHPPLSIESANEMVGWLTETQQASYIPTRDGVVGGVIEDDAGSSMRTAGDTVTYNGLLWVYGPSGDLIPLGVGPGCYVDNQGIFHQEVRYDVIQLVGPTEVSSTDEPAVRGADIVETLGERVGAYTLDPARYASARSAPYMYVRLTCSLVPTVNALRDPEYGNLIGTFPHRASVRVMRLNSTEDVNGLYVTEGLPVPLDFFEPGGGIAGVDLSRIEVSQPGGANISVADSAPLALNLDNRFFLQVFGSVHAYTDEEVEAILPGQDPDVVRSCTECVLDILSVTLEIEGVLGRSPFIDVQGTRYTLSAR